MKTRLLSSIIFTMILFTTSYLLYINQDIYNNNYKLTMLVHFIAMGISFFIYLISFIIISFIKKNKNNIKLHKLLNIAALYLLLTGLISIIINNINLGDLHQENIHTILGKITTVLVLFTSIAALFRFKINKYHKYIGRVTFIALLITYVLGLLLLKSFLA